MSELFILTNVSDDIHKVVSAILKEKDELSANLEKVRVERDVATESCNNLAAILRDQRACTDRLERELFNVRKAWNEREPQLYAAERRVEELTEERDALKAENELLKARTQTAESIATGYRAMEQKLEETLRVCNALRAENERLKQRGRAICCGYCGEAFFQYPAGEFGDKEHRKAIEAFHFHDANCEANPLRAENENLKEVWQAERNNLARLLAPFFGRFSEDLMRRFLASGMFAFHPGGSVTGAPLANFGPERTGTDGHGPARTCTDGHGDVLRDEDSAFDGGEN